MDIKEVFQTYGKLSISLFTLALLIMYFYWGGIKAASGIFVGVILTTILLATEKGRLVIDMIESRRR